MQVYSVVIETLVPICMPLKYSFSIFFCILHELQKFLFHNVLLFMCNDKANFPETFFRTTSHRKIMLLN